MCLLRVFRFFSLFGKKCFHNIYINYQITLHAKLTTSTHTRSLARSLRNFAVSRPRFTYVKAWYGRNGGGVRTTYATCTCLCLGAVSFCVQFINQLCLLVHLARVLFLLVWKKNEIIYMRSKYQSMAEEEGGGGKRGKKFENVCFVQHRSRWKIFEFSI